MKLYFPFMRDLFDMSTAFSNAISDSIKFSTELFNSFAKAHSIYLNTLSEYNKSWKDLAELEKILRSKYRRLFNEKFREERFINTLSDTLASYSQLAKTTGLGTIYQDLSNRLSA